MRVTVQQLSEITEAAVCSLRRGGSSDDWDDIEEYIQLGVAKLFRVTNDSYLVLSVNRHFNELFIHACSGNDASILMKLCLQIAKQNDCIRVTFCTVKRGLLRLLKDFNPVHMGENLYKVEVNANY